MLEEPIGDRIKRGAWLCIAISLVLLEMRGFFF